jgi:pyruvate,orthophosphate dikinase
LTKWLYQFGKSGTRGGAMMRDLLGGKGADLAEMCNLGLPVPPGFIITTELCTHYYSNGQTYPDDFKGQVDAALGALEEAVGAGFGDAGNPLLVSVRSGARVSMPGMMDTVLDLGLNDDTVEGLARRGENPRFAFDSYRRFIQMYSNVVLDIDHGRFEALLDDYKEKHGVTLDTMLGAKDWQELIAAYKSLVAERMGAPFPQDVHEQLWGAIGAVLRSWMNQRAVTYRSLHGIPGDWGTAVAVQAMVFGNMGDDCATGVAFTRNPASGESAYYGEYLVNAQGEDVVAGIRTPQTLTLAAKEASGSALPALEEVMPEVFADLMAVRETLENHYRDMQDIEFTVQKGKLWMLQTRRGKRTTAAAVKIAIDMVHEGLIGREEAIKRIDPATLDQLLHPTLDAKAERDVIARGLAASPGAASGAVVFTPEDAEARAAQGEKVILARIETSPEDIHGMNAAEGIVTATGGITSHAAVVARGMGRPCVAGAGDLAIDYANGRMSVGEITVMAGHIITIDGSAGEVMVGEVPMVRPALSDDFALLMNWADDVRRLKVRANAETPEDARTARQFGAEGIGLCRTEHMFFGAERIVAMREMILAKDAAMRRAALAKILPMQRQDFIELFRIMAGLPVTIRLLDPPLHEFLPVTEDKLREVAKAAGVGLEAVRRRVAELEESNPMLGHRGCRLAITYPEISEMQARAIFEAAARVFQDTGETVLAEVMIPLVAVKSEFDVLKALVDEVAAKVSEETGVSFDYRVGTMIELPRAALAAGEIAEGAEFFSFGTNDLTQTTFGLSRDDAARFLPAYQEQAILAQDPFVSLDVEGVGELVRIAVERGRRTRPDIELGICGEHGGDPASIQFCEQVGLDYVSCSPYRVPVARLAAAQATLA